MIKPLGSNVVVKLKQRDSHGGIMIPEKAQKEMELEVMAIGPDVKKIKEGESIICLPTDVVFLLNWIGVDKNLGIVAEDKIKAKVLLTSGDLN